MSDPFVGEIRMAGFNFAPTGWAFCDGQLMPIAQNTALFSLLGTIYGGDGRTTFALPNLQGASPMNQGAGPGLTPRYAGEMSGTSVVDLLTTDMPGHTHSAQGVNAGSNRQGPTGNAWAEVRGLLYATAANGLMHPQAIGLQGGSQPHNNMPPYLVVNFIIALQGVFPPRS